MKGIAVVFIVLFALALFLFGPLITIWAINLLFGLHIPSTYATWFASFWLMAVLGTGKISVKTK